MPYVAIRVTDESVTVDQKAVLIEETTEMLQRVLGKDPATTHVVIDEVNTDNWGVAGVSVTTLRSDAEASQPL